jgi:diguanylate cyclase (GGDEF)-like protein
MALVIVVLTLLFATHRYILSNYHAIETLQNERIVEGLIKNIQTQIDFTKRIVVDYAEWDDTYAFVQGENSDYVHANFRQNSETLETLGVCTMVFVDAKGELAYSIDAAQASHSVQDIEDLVDNIQEHSSGFLLANGILHFYYARPITNSDKTLSPNGWLLAMDKIDLFELKSHNPELQKVSLSAPFAPSDEMKTYYFDTFRFDVLTHWQPEEVEVWVNIINHQGAPMHAIQVVHGREILMQGKQTLRLFLFIVGGMLVVIFGLLWARQKEMQREKAHLEKTVQHRTKELHETMRNLRQAVKKLESIAYVDELTGARTRRSFFEAIRPILERAQMNKKQVCVVLIDLDDFKIVNDTYGHAAGDTVLKHFCASCMHFMDERMMLARLGGEEFVISFFDMSLKNAEALCLKIQTYIGENPVPVDARTHVSYTFSYGIADNAKTSNIDYMLQEADHKMYEAKTEVKNLIRNRE